MAFFAGRGHQVTLIAPIDRPVADGLDPRISLVRMREYSGRVFGRLSSIGARGAIREVLGKVRPDILHVHDLTTGFGRVARVSGFHPYVVTTWGSDLYLQMPRSRLSRLAGRLTLSGADLVTMETQDLRRVAIASGAHPERTRIVQFGVDTEEYRPTAPDPVLRARLGLDGRRVVFSPRQIAPIYDHLSVIGAVAGLAPDIAILASARGADPEYLRRVEEAARAQAMESRLVIVPTIPREEMPAHVALADVVVSVPRSDSISVSVLEAMASGRPVVATDLPSPREFLAGVDPTLLVPVADPASLAAAIEHVLGSSPDQLARWAASSRAIVVDRAERRTNMLLMEATYRTLIPSHRGSAAA